MKFDRQKYYDLYFGSEKGHKLTDSERIIIGEGRYRDQVIYNKANAELQWVLFKELWFEYLDLLNSIFAHDTDTGHTPNWREYHNLFFLSIHQKVMQLRCSCQYECMKDILDIAYKILMDRVLHLHEKDKQARQLRQEKIRKENEKLI